MTTDQWLPIPNYPGYEVSSGGEVRSYRVSGFGFGSMRPVPKMLKPRTQTAGYYTVSLRRDGKTELRTIHSLVALVFIGPRPDGMDVCHNDGDVENNAVENLRYASRSENIRDQVLHGTHFCATKTHCIHGHEYTTANTLIDTSSGARRCRKCRSQQRRAA